MSRPGTARLIWAGIIAALLIAAGAVVAIVTLQHVDPHRSPAQRLPEPSLLQISTDRLPRFSVNGAAMQHRTEVEPVVVAHGDTVVSVFEVGRNASGFGAQAIGFAVSHDAGATWAQGVLPGVTASSPRPQRRYPVAVNQTVAFDARHGRWLVSSVGYLPVSGNRGLFRATALLINTSSDGQSWTRATRAVAADVDKPWLTCDNSPASPDYGTCYAAYTQFADGYRLSIVRTRNAGRTWSSPVHVPAATPGRDAVGYDVNLVVQPSGRVVAVANDLRLGFTGSSLFSFISTNGGRSWSRPQLIATTRFHLPTTIGAEGLRAKNKPIVAADGGGRVWTAWSDCRFRSGCSSDDIVLASSADGISWTVPRPVTNGRATGEDDVLPGLAVEAGTAGPRTHLAVSYYSFLAGSCAGCGLRANYVTSFTAGTSWSQPRPFRDHWVPVSWLAGSPDGRMVGDFSSVSFAGARAIAVAALPAAPSTKGAFDQSVVALRVPAEWGRSRRG